MMALCNGREEIKIILDLEPVRIARLSNERWYGTEINERALASIDHCPGSDREHVSRGDAFDEGHASRRGDKR